MNPLLLAAFVTLPPDVLYVAESVTRSIQRRDADTGALLGHALAPSGLPTTAACFALGNDGVLYVPEPSSGSILRYDPLTGAQLGTLALSPAIVPAGLAISDAGLLFVADATGMYVFDALTGALVANGAPYSYDRVVRGADGQIYASGRDPFGSYVDRFDPTTGAFAAVLKFEQPVHGGYFGDIVFAADGYLHVVYNNYAPIDSSLWRCSPPAYGTCFSFAGTSITVVPSSALALRSNGDVYASGSWEFDGVGIRRLAGTTGALLGSLKISGVTDLEFERPFDCNGNGTSDALDIASGMSTDCNANQRPDECDLAFGSSLDADGNGVPDECAVLAASGATASIGAQGSQALALDAGPAHAGSVYLVLGSTTGSAPPLLVDGVALALVPDAYFAFTLANPNSAIVPGSLGVLDAAGDAQASVQIPPGTSATLAGMQLWHAFVGVEFSPLPHVAIASNAVALLLVP
jgi:hypothetical protein